MRQKRPFGEGLEEPVRAELSARYRKTPDFIGGTAANVQVTEPQIEPQTPSRYTEFGQLPPHMKTVYRSDEKGFRLMEDVLTRRRVLQFLEKPPQEVIDLVKSKGMKYDGSMWGKSLVPPSGQEPLTRDEIAGYAASIRDMTDRLAMDLSGKAERLGYEGQGR